MVLAGIHDAVEASQKGSHRSLPRASCRQLALQQTPQPAEASAAPQLVLTPAASWQERQQAVRCCCRLCSESQKAGLHAKTTAYLLMSLLWFAWSFQRAPSKWNRPKTALHEG